MALTRKEGVVKGDQSGMRIDLFLAAMFPDKSNAEDKAYSERLNPFLRTEVSIPQPIYHYKYSSQNKEYV